MCEDGVDLRGASIDQPDGRKRSVTRHSGVSRERLRQLKGANLSAAWQMVPHVSAMSSTRMATRSLTSPTSTMRSTSLAFFLSLWMRAKSTLIRSAMDVTLRTQTERLTVQERLESADSIPPPVYLTNGCPLTPCTYQICSPLRSTGIWRHNYAILPLRNVLLDPLQDGGLCIQVVDRNVEKSLQNEKNKLINNIKNIYIF